MALLYCQILMGHQECQNGEMHDFILHNNIQQFTSLAACKVNFKTFTNTGKVYKGVEHRVRFLCQPPVTGNLMPFVYDGIAAAQSDDECSTDSEDTDSDDGSQGSREIDSNDRIKPWLKWELYKIAKCGDEEHLILYRASSQIHLDMVDCVYEFAEYYLSEVHCSHPQWRLHIYCN